MELTGPAWVRQGDGSLEPFDADRICGALFRVGERLGRPDAFLARELTDGVVHFLQAEHEGGIATVADVREVVVKVVRELGKPHLARAYEEATPPRIGPVRPPEPSGPGGFSRELLSAHAEGLLVLGGLDTPAKLTARVLPWPRSADDLEPTLARMQAVVAETLVLDGPEYWLARVALSPEAFLARVESVLRQGGLTGVLNLNVAVPPAALGELAPGPLFGEPTEGQPHGEVALRLIALAGEPWRIVWHLANAGTTAPARAGIEYVPGRARRQVPLDEGLDRTAGGLLLRVGVRLSRLPAGESALDKVGTLARLALSAGVQRRAYLRRVSDGLLEGFLLDRALLQVVPLGLETFVEPIRRKLVRRLREVLRAEGGRVQLATCLEGPTLDLGELDLNDTDVTRRLRAIGQLHEAAGRGCLTLRITDDRQIPAWLALIESNTAIDRVRFVRSGL